jgi:hypothetical protein
MKKRVLLFLLCILLVTITTQLAIAQDDILRVDVAESLGTISPYSYGANYGPPYMVPLDLVPQAEASGVTYFRIPAGRWGDDNDLTPFLIDLHYNQAQQWGMEMAISVRLPGSGGSPEQAAALVQYTLDSGYAVRYWAIGNEPDLLDAYMAEDNGGDFSTVRIDDYNRDWRVTAEAMLAVNLDIIMIGPDVSQFPPTSEGDPYNNVRREWVREFLKANGDLVDIVSIHRYPFPLGMIGGTSIEQLRGNPPEWDVVIENLREVIRDVMGEELPIAVTEINSHWSNGCCGEATPDSFYNAIWWAAVLGRLIEQKVEIIAYFSFQSGGSSGAFGLLSRYEVRPTYYVYQLYQRFGSTLLSATVDDLDVSGYAALRDDGALTLIVVNLGPEEREITLEIVNGAINGPAEVWLLDETHNAEVVDEAMVIEPGAEVVLPAQSVTLYIIPLAGE